MSLKHHLFTELSSALNITYLILIGLFIHVVPSSVQAATILNGSFESGFSSWIASDIGAPHQTLLVRPNGFNSGFSFFSTTATHGVNSASHGFDGSGPGTISISQDVGTIDATSRILTFDYRAAWDMLNYGGSTLDRVFTVVLRPSGGGSPITSFEILRAVAGTLSFDTGNRSVALDLSAFIGQSVRLSFESYIPQDFTGPGFLQLDNVLLIAVPEPNRGVLFLGGAIFVATMRRRSGYSGKK